MLKAAMVRGISYTPPTITESAMMGGVSYTSPIITAYPEGTGSPIKPLPDSFEEFIKEHNQEREVSLVEKTKQREKEKEFISKEYSRLIAQSLTKWNMKP